MIFVYKKWDKFCADLKAKHIISMPACKMESSQLSYLILKHDVETNVKRAYSIARIEHKYGHCGSYYVQAYLLNNENNVRLLKKMQMMGHEISYHYDVMDSCKGNLDLAIKEFECNKQTFEANGFAINTVCQHGNPIVERVGYTSNRDFFRSDRVRKIYPEISDIMVNFQSFYHTEYTYYSDAGRCFKRIYDPLNNDVVNSAEKDRTYRDLDDVLSEMAYDGRNIISIHPHRWTKSAIAYMIKMLAFRIIRGTARLLIKIPVLKKIMSRFYYLAKKI